MERIEVATNSLTSSKNDSDSESKHSTPPFSNENTNRPRLTPRKHAVLPIAGAVPGRPGVDLDSLVVQLASVVGELEKRSGAEWRREAGYLDAVSTLFETQDRLSRQLEILLHRIAFLNAERSAAREQGRAIA